MAFSTIWNRPVLLYYPVTTCPLIIPLSTVFQYLLVRWILLVSGRLNMKPFLTLPIRKLGSGYLPFLWFVQHDWDHEEKHNWYDIYSSVTVIVFYNFTLQYVVTYPLMLHPVWHLPLTHSGWNQMDAVSQTTVSNALSWMKIYEFRLRFHWNLFLMIQSTKFQHWFG